ncbi:MAG: class I SAM-dependent methyltransferase [Nitrososphaerota archaeon]|jgi:ubiquinone/menaquinone biosynthesis C-methylase UbiE|nr:class I SAM-dependent methyltransferase [Nitrososphaerota archaeon]MDG6927557.1 class I SAM-dependent methyltransferase [Nitrososphaerota archaeon]MDG6930670.1 class I SAM-dependent methyltransferase [Nitrososphaerota archaeon]MDG6932505.1 class I SAM-dependent methyltransferase [Nitrososphaerota archaeon]MDG6936214.1 class I SAM-dependent methyltransferase [Nitrososphaerota archaeon]
MEFNPATYDKWYEYNRTVFLQEADIIRAAGIEGRSAEIGAGTGRFAGELGAELAMDQSRVMIEFAKTRVKSVLVGSACSLPFRDKSMDTLIFAFSMSFIKCKVQALNEAKRVSKSLIILDFAPGDSYLEDLKTEFKEIEPLNLNQLNLSGTSIQTNRATLNLKDRQITLTTIKLRWQ